MKTIGLLVIGACIPFLVGCLYVFAREIISVEIYVIRYERAHGVPRNRTTLRRWAWWLFVRPGFQLGPLYEDEKSRRRD